MVNARYDYFEAPNWHPEKEKMFKLLRKCGFRGFGKTTGPLRGFDRGECRVWVNKYTAVWETRGMTGTGLRSLAAYIGGL